MSGERNRTHDVQRRNACIFPYATRTIAAKRQKQTILSLAYINLCT